MNQLALIEKMSPLEIFGSGKIEDILFKISAEAKAQEIDISNEKGRKEAASLAYKIARSKTLLDDLGKKLGEEARLKLNAINSERKKSNEFLDSLKDEIRRPLTEWENKEKNRITDHEKAIFHIVSIGSLAEQNWLNMKFADVANLLSDLSLTNRDWEEFKLRADKEIAATTSKLQSVLKNIKAREDEQAELERLRKAETARLQKERDDKIAIEAAESARLAAEKKAKLEADRVAEAAEKERQAIIMEKNKLEERAANAEKEKLLAIERERQRVESEKQARLDAEKKREANKNHCAKINNDILSAFISLGCGEMLGTNLVDALASGVIPHTKISY